MYNPVRRNRHIGTAKQGYRRQSRFVIPESRHRAEPYCHQLGPHTQVVRKVHQKDYCFLVEHTRAHCCHACTIDDLVTLLSWLDPNTLEGLQIIVLRQPKRKQETLCSVWGRIRYYFERAPYSGAAIILEAVDYSRLLVRPKRLSVEGMQEFKRLKADGYHFQESKRTYSAPFSLESVRATQLYRTFLHEIGHYQQYLEYVQYPLQQLEEQIAALEDVIDWDSDDACPHFMRWETLTDEYDAVSERMWEQYDHLPELEKEKYAFRYAERVRNQLEQENKIPFPRNADVKLFYRDRLREEDFLLSGTDESI